jgi:hypothetical protein
MIGERVKAVAWEGQNVFIISRDNNEIMHWTYGTAYAWTHIGGAAADIFAIDGKVFCHKIHNGSLW